jgi:hypothetical protein
MTHPNCKPFTPIQGLLYDEVDAPMIESHRWFKMRSGYIVRGKRDGTVKRTLLLHREIMCPPEGMDVDHINHNTLDNRRCNLRIVTRQQNAQNNRSTGAYYFKPRKKWMAYAKLSGKMIYLGYFSERDAAIAASTRFKEQHYAGHVKKG